MNQTPLRLTLETYVDGIPSKIVRVLLMSGVNPKLQDQDERRPLDMGGGSHAENTRQRGL